MTKKENKGIKEIVYKEERPYIAIETRKEAPGGGIIEQKRITVCGDTLKECKEIYDKIRKEK